LREDAVEILFIIRIKDISKKKADKGIGSTFTTLCYIEDDELNQFGCLYRQDLILENQQHLSNNFGIVIKSVKIAE
jgi:hypothetical protein